MFDLVADVERYPEFLPLCSGMKLRSRKEQAEGTGVTGGSGDAESTEEQKFANMAAEVAKATGIQFV